MQCASVTCPIAGSVCCVSFPVSYTPHFILRCLACRKEWQVKGTPAHMFLHIALHSKTFRFGCFFFSGPLYRKEGKDSSVPKWCLLKQRRTLHIPVPLRNVSIICQCRVHSQVSAHTVWDLTASWMIIKNKYTKTRLQSSADFFSFFLLIRDVSTALKVRTRLWESDLFAIAFVCSLSDENTAREILPGLV